MEFIWKITLLLTFCFPFLLCNGAEKNNSLEKKEMNKDRCDISECSLRGRDGRDGSNGDNGRDGRDGKDGKDGHDGKDGERGPPGNRGEKGDLGPVGTKGARGLPGTQGLQGKIGISGSKGEKGEAGSSSGIKHANWKHCVWQKEDGKDNGVIRSCSFNKSSSMTALRVSYGGTLRIGACTGCCKRWYFTFNGHECNNPLPIDGVFYLSINNDIQRHRVIEGICEGLRKGYVNVQFMVGNCKGYGDADAYSGWNSVSRIMIEELSPMQP